MKRSLKVKLSATGICLLVFFVGLNILFTYFWMSPFSMRFTANRMEKLVNTIKKQMDLPEEDFQEYIEQISEDYSATVTVFDSNKKIIITTSISRARKNRLGKTTEQLFDENINLLEKGKAVRFFKKKNNTVQADSALQQKKVSKLAVDEAVSIIVVKKLADDRYISLHRTYKSFYNATISAILFDMLAGVVIIVCGVFVVLRLSNYIVKPVKEITEVAEHIANLEFDMKAPENNQDEIGQLGCSVNLMSKYLESYLVRLQEDIESRKKLIRNLAHEIKSPAAVIMGYSDRMKAIIEKNPEKVMQYCEIISNESNRIDMLVKEMLDFSKMEQRMERTNPESFPLIGLLEKVAVRIREENVDRTFTIQIQCEDEKIVADYGLLERAVYNLANNAVSHGAGEELVITLKGTIQNDQMTVLVHNTGSHILEEELPYIWEVFYKVDKARVRNKNGCGVGLSIVKEIAEIHQGSCEAGNDENGVYFSITIPQ